MLGRAGHTGRWFDSGLGHCGTTVPVTHLAVIALGDPIAAHVAAVVGQPGLEEEAVRMELGDEESFIFGVDVHQPLGQE